MPAKDMKGSELLTWLDSMNKAERVEARKIEAEIDAAGARGSGPIERWVFVRTVMDLRHRGVKIDVDHLQSEALIAGLFVLRDKYKLPNEHQATARKPKAVRGV